ncbi:MAG: nucleotidyltransferase domain-containing protein [Planctomycetes bacterium]|nr:nucleotidyltransferase domain-containing protein [Planctomycetota bacterium]
MGVSQVDIRRCAEIAAGFGVTRLVIFGSAASSPETARDLDLACDGIDGWRLFELGARLEEALPVGVDLVPLQPETRFTRYILRKGRVLYDRR